MRRMGILLALWALLGAFGCRGDQLQWIPWEVCEEAVAEIMAAPILLSYCSLADDAYVEVWQVAAADIAPTSAEGLYEVVLFGRRLLESRCAFAPGEIDVPVEFVALRRQRASVWLLQGIDLAYVYLPVGEGRYVCLGRLLDQPCDVKTESLCFSGRGLPASVGRRLPPLR